ncbi:unnamed protein product [Trichogramma brassicae]|uniref:Uncharacterized protein n=1 Tax=Trichogramma brassicae TaxID=86971 RepID=A0A6H5IAI7_9HYME|nr:unnamed protein product [Trichogramma brassicae]
MFSCVCARRQTTSDDESDGSVRGEGRRCHHKHKSNSKHEDRETKLKKLKKSVKKIKWEVKEERLRFLYKFDISVMSWEGHQPPGADVPQLRDILQKEHIELLLSDSVCFRSEQCQLLGQRFIQFAIASGYKDEPELDEAGKPLLRRTTSVHHAGRNIAYSFFMNDLFQIYDRFDANYVDESGLTHLHVACMHGRHKVVAKFLELGQVDPDCVWRETGDSPLHLAIRYGFDYNAIELLLRNGADPNLANAEGSTPLHAMCRRKYDDDLVEFFFEISDHIERTVRLDAKDKSGRTPLQWAVAKLLPDTVDVLLNRGADLSSFVFPGRDYFGEGLRPWLDDGHLAFPLRLGSGALAIVERLEKGGYEMDQSDALTIMAFFKENGLYEKSANRDENWYDDEVFASQAKGITITPSLSLYDLIRLRPEEAENRLTFVDCFTLASTNFDRSLRRGPGKACAENLCEKLSRKFFRSWAIESFMKLTRYRLPLECCKMIIDESFKNEDLWNILLASS